MMKIKNSYMPNKKRKMDPKLVAAKQRAEIAYIAKKAKCRAATVRSVVKEVGRSRVKVYAKLRSMGYAITTRKFK
jgi:hypothetical protein